MVVAVSNKIALRATRAAAAAAALLLVSGPARAEDAAINDEEILGETPDDSSLTMTAIGTRLSAYDQKGHGYQSKAGPFLGPGSERLTVFEPQLEVLAKQGDRITHRLWIPVDVVSSASADAIDRDRAPPDAISGASRRNEAGTVDWTVGLRATPTVDVSLRNGIHLEEEFRSWHSGLQVSKGFREQSTVVAVGVLTVFDWFDEFDIRGFRHGRTRRATETASLGVTQVLTPTTLAEASYGVTVQSGELGNTWNVVPLSDGSVGAELLPRSRLRHAIVGRLAQALPWNGVIKGYYRFYEDDWSIVAHTLEGQLLQRFTPAFYVGVGVRHHAQFGADFFTVRAPPQARARTADSDLETLQSDSVSARVAFDVPLQAPGPRLLHIDFGYERYWRTNDLRTQVLTCATGFSF